MYRGSRRENEWYLEEGHVREEKLGDFITLSMNLARLVFYSSIAAV